MSLEPGSIEETSPLSAATRAVLTRREHRHASVLIYHRDGIAVAPLHRGVEVVVGRDAPADVRIPDASLSRRHARFTQLDASIVVEDLGSTNGTWIAGRQIEREEIRPGDEIVLGSVTARVHVPLAGDGELPGVEGHERFRARLAEEVSRARYFGRRVAVLMVSAGRRNGPHVGRWYPQARAVLRSVDHLALFSEDTAEILLTELSRTEALATATAIAGLKIEGEQPLLVGAALFPDGARSSEELFEVCHAALLKAAPSRPVSCAPDEPFGAASDATSRRDAGHPIAVAPKMRELFEDAARLARSVIPVLILGETGTGKEVVARAIHERGPRRDKPLVYLNCGAVPGQLVENILFGHERGAYTGAAQRQKGIFEAADGGTVMLDEVGELALPFQAALLRVLETKRVQRVGASDEIDVNVRILAATHRDLEAMVDSGAFRRDLLYRLNAMTLVVPPLRERVDEIDLLVDCFLRTAREENGSPVRSIAPAALDRLRRYPWPGNVRELRNAIERAVVIARGSEITERDLPERVRAVDTEGAASSPEPDVPPIAQRGDFKTRMQHHEKHILLSALREAGGNQTEAARRLRMPLRTFAYKLKLHRINRLGHAGE